MPIVYADDAPVTSPDVPSTLRPIAPLALDGAGTRSFLLTEQMMQLDFRINDKHDDPTRVDARAQLAATEIWTVSNMGDMDHPFHLHGFSFQMLDRSGMAEPVIAWKDSVLVHASETVLQRGSRGRRLWCTRRTTSPVHVPSVAPMSTSALCARISDTRKTVHRSPTRKSAGDGTRSTSLAPFLLTRRPRRRRGTRDRGRRRRLGEIEHQVHALLFEPERGDFRERCVERARRAPACRPTR